MKKLLFLLPLLAAVSCTKCKDQNTAPHPYGNDALYPPSVVLLKVDYLTKTFEGGTELTLSGSIQDTDTLPILVDYKEPGDFGDVTLRYQPTNDTLFFGTMVWMGLGKMYFPDSLQPASTFPTSSDPAVEVDSTRFQKLHYYASADPAGVWEAVNKLKIVSEYSKSGKKIGVFLYRPSQGVGDPNNWDWFVVMSR